MGGDQQRIEEYARAFEDHLVGSAREKARTTSELVEHLSDAADEGELPEAMQRLGSPEQAAAAFARERSMPLASLRDRFAAALIDNVPLVGLTIALVVQAVVAGRDFTATFPPVFHARFGDACVSLTPFGCDAYAGSGPVYGVGMALAVAWSILGVGLLESLTGTTPGKRLRGLRVVTDRGLRVPVLAAVLRRLSFLTGPLAWMDWAPFLTGQRRRILDQLTASKVVVARGHSRAHPSPFGAPGGP